MVGTIYMFSESEEVAQMTGRAYRQMIPQPMLSKARPWVLEGAPLVVDPMRRFRAFVSLRSSVGNWKDVDIWVGAHAGCCWLGGKKEVRTEALYHELYAKFTLTRPSLRGRRLRTVTRQVVHAYRHRCRPSRMTRPSSSPFCTCPSSSAPSSLSSSPCHRMT